MPGGGQRFGLERRGRGAVDDHRPQAVTARTEVRSEHEETARRGVALFGVAGATSYGRVTPDGIVPWRERPQEFRKGVVARIPPAPVLP